MTQIIIWVLAIGFVTACLVIAWFWAAMTFAEECLNRADEDRPPTHTRETAWKSSTRSHRTTVPTSPE